MAPTNGMVAGMYSGWASRRTTAGYPMGTSLTPDAPTVNTVYGAYRLKYPVSIGRPSTTRKRAKRVGGQRDRGYRNLGKSIEPMPFVMDGFDEALDGYVRDYTPDTTYNTSMTLTANNQLQTTPPRFVVGFSYGFTDTDNGVDYYDTTVWNNAYLEPPEGDQSSQSDGDNPNPLEWNLVPDLSTRMGFGGLYSSTALALIENTDTYVRLRSTYELYLTTWIANGSATTFTLPFKPMSSDATGAAGNIILLNGVITAVTSVSTSTGVVTISAAGSSGQIWTVLYPTRYIPS